MAYTYRASETVQASQVTGTLADFPALFARTCIGGVPGSPDFRSRGNGGKVADAAGADLNLVTSLAMTTKLDMETLEYNAAAGRVKKFGRVSSCTVGTVVYWAYGDSSISTSQDNAGGVWDANFTGVYHFNDGSTLSLAGSTTTPRNMTNPNSVGATSGPIYGAAGHFNQTSHYLVNATAPITAVPLTIECYSKLTDTTFGTNEVRIMGAVAKTSGLEEFWIDYHELAGLLYLRTVTQAAGVPFFANYALTPDTNYHHIMGTFIDASTFALTYDGATITPTTGGTAAIVPSGLTDTYIGGIYYNTSNFYGGWKGDLTEVRYSNIARSVAWGSATYKSTWAPTTFWGQGLEERAILSAVLFEPLLGVTAF